MCFSAVGEECGKGDSGAAHVLDLNLTLPLVSSCIWLLVNCSSSCFYDLVFCWYFVYTFFVVIIVVVVFVIFTEFDAPKLISLSALQSSVCWVIVILPLPHSPSTCVYVCVGVSKAQPCRCSCTCYSRAGEGEGPWQSQLNFFECLARYQNVKCLA